jgi:outer membrane protein assembly factor BamB
MVVALGPSNGAVYWQYPFAGNAPPALDVADGALYVAAADQNLYALDAHTGLLRWRYQVGAAFSAAANGSVFVFTSTGTLLALDASDASVRWQKQLAGGGYFTPVISNGTLYVGAADGLAAFNAQDGSLRWQNHAGGGVSAQPLLADGVIYTLSADGHCEAIAASNGALRWQAACGVLTAGAPAFVTTAGILFYDMVSGDSAAGAQGGLFGLNTTTGAALWKKHFMGNVPGPLTASDGMVYAGCGNALSAFQSSNGALRWNFSSAGSSNALLLNGALYVGSNAGSVYALTSSDGSARWHSAVGSPVMVIALGQ